jgi:hypothetical protein
VPSRRHDGHVVEESLRKLLGLADAVISGDRDPLDADIPDVVLTAAKLVARMSQH